MSKYLSAAEPIARGIFSRSHLTGKNPHTGVRRVRPNAFLEGEGEQLISVDRTAGAPIEDLVRLGEERALRRRRTFYGWGKLLVSEAEGSGRGVKVRESRKLDNPYHADIVLPENTEPATQKHVARRLARKARWCRKPPVVPTSSATA